MLTLRRENREGLWIVVGFLEGGGKALPLVEIWRSEFVNKCCTAREAFIDSVWVERIQLKIEFLIEIFGLSSFL